MRLVAAIALVFAACGGGSDAAQDAATNDAEGQCGTSASDLIGCVEQSRLAADMALVAMPRVPLTGHWQMVQDLCRTRFEAAGFDVELHDYGTGVNVIGRLEGTEPQAGDVIVSAHYDHISGCAGADDNATGVAATLEIARLLGGRENRRSLVVACWDEEERGLLGSIAYADRASTSNTTIHSMISLESIGFYSNEPDSQTLATGFDVLFPTQTAEIEARDRRGDFIALIGDQRSVPVAGRIDTHAASLGLETSNLDVSDPLLAAPETADLRRSDHAAFWQAGYPGLMLTDTANFRNPNYHCSGGAMDVPETIDLDFFTQVTQATIGAVVDTLDAP